MSPEQINKSILIFTDKYPFGNGESFFGLELTYLSETFERITILPLERTYSSKRRQCPEGITILDPPFTSIKNKKELILKGLFNKSAIKPFVLELFRSGIFTSPLKLRNWFIHFLLVRGSVAYLRSRDTFIRLGEYNILFFYWGLRWSQVIPFIDTSKVKTVVRFHGSDLYNERNNNYIPFRIQQLEKIDLAVFISEMGKSYLIQRFAQYLKSTVVARLGTEDFGLGPINNHTVHMVSCSNIVALKQIDKIANALSFLNREIIWTHLGDGPLREKILAIVHRNKQAKVIFKGHLSHSELMAFYQNHPVDFFINTSLSEGVPVSVMEALSFGIPVIATDVGGTAEIVDEKVGLLISPEIGPKELAKAINGFLNQNGHINLRMSARKRWEERCQAKLLYTDFARLLKTF